MVASISAISRSFLRICAAVASRSFATRCRSVMIPGSAAVLSGRRLSGWLVRTWLAVGAAVEDTAVRERERGGGGSGGGVTGGGDLPAGRLCCGSGVWTGWAAMCFSITAAQIAWPSRSATAHQLSMSE